MIANGYYYTDLDNDLTQSAVAANHAMQTRLAIQLISKHLHALFSLYSNELIIYVDQQQIAHWSYLIKGKVNHIDTNIIIDANSNDIYQQWTEHATLGSMIAAEQTNVEAIDGALLLASNTAGSLVAGGGYGGNEKIGKKYYDSLAYHLPAFMVTRPINANICIYMDNRIMVMKDAKNIATYSCEKQDGEHHAIYWNDHIKKINGAYAIDNDAFFAAQLTGNMFHDWYGLPIYMEHGIESLLPIFFKENYDNSTWTNDSLTIGTGMDLYYPLTSLDVIAFLIAQIFTAQHSELYFRYGESGGVSVAFADLTGQAAQYYLYGANNWKVGADIMKQGEALRYFEQPTKDGHSIDSYKNYIDGLYPWYSAGIFERAFYLLANTTNWNTKKVFDLAVDANRYYWTEHTSFKNAACGIKHAAYDNHANVVDVINAFAKVGIDIRKC
jgi:pseudolysin